MDDEDIASCTNCQKMEHGLLKLQQFKQAIDGATRAA